MFGVHPTTSHYDRASWNETLYGEAAFASKGGSVPTLFRASYEHCMRKRIQAEPQPALKWSWPKHVTKKQAKPTNPTVM